MYYDKQTKCFVIEVFSSSQRIINDLQGLGVQNITSKDFLSTFWGKRISFPKPRGKGSNKLIDILHRYVDRGFILEK
jgi:hypothetical protein